MNTDTTADLKPANTPSADFVRAISDLLDTDPADLLHELGYYDRTRRPVLPPPVVQAPSATANAR
jgi:hypothetical protein